MNLLNRNNWDFSSMELTVGPELVSLVSIQHSTTLSKFPAQMKQSIASWPNLEQAARTWLHAVLASWVAQTLVERRRKSSRNVHQSSSNGFGRLASVSIKITRRTN